MSEEYAKIIDGMTWEHHTERIIEEKYKVPVQAEFQCTNCGYTEKHIILVYTGEMAWVAQGTKESEDCVRCGDATRILLPHNPVLVLTDGSTLRTRTKEQ